MLLDLEEKEDFTDKSVGGTALRCHTVRGKQIFDRRRFSSENALLSACPWHNADDFKEFKPYEPRDA